MIVRPSRDSRLDPNEHVRGGVPVKWPDIGSVTGDARYRRANGAVMAATGLLGILDVETVARLNGELVPPGVWAVYERTT